EARVPKKLRQKSGGGSRQSHQPRFKAESFRQSHSHFSCPCCRSSDRPCVLSGSSDLAGSDPADRSPFGSSAQENERESHRCRVPSGAQLFLDRHGGGISSGSDTACLFSGGRPPVFTGAGISLPGLP